MFLDTTILVEIFKGNKEILSGVEEIAAKEPMMVSIVQIGELADWCHANKLNPAKVIAETKSMATIAGITEEICIKASEIKQRQREAGKTKFGLIDGFITATALSLEQKLLTSDDDFEGLENATLI